MELIDFVRLVKRKKQTIVSIVVIFVVFTAIFTFIQPLRYGVESRVLVVQTNNIGNDSYATARTNEYLGSIMSRVVPSNTFFNEVVDSPFKINREYFEGDTRKQMKLWKKTVVAKSLNETGIIEISVFHEDRYQGEQIARAVNYILTTKHDLYHGLGESVVIKIIDQPVASKYPVEPNIFLNFPLAFILSIIVSLIYIYSFPTPVYDIRLIPKIRRRKKVVKDENKSTDVSSFVKTLEVKEEKEITEVRIDNHTNYQKKNNKKFKNKKIKNLNNYNFSKKGNISNLF